MIRSFAAFSILSFQLLSSVYGRNGDQHDDGHCDPPIEDGLIVTPFKRSYSHGETIKISCADGYELNADKRTSTCKQSEFIGLKSRFVPTISGSTCKEPHTCKPPVALGLIVTPLKSSYELGEKIKVSCIDGYELVGKAVHICKRHSFHRGTYEADISLGIRSDISYTRNHFGFDDGDACVEIRGCDIPVGKGLIVEPFKRTYSPGEEILLSCEEEYMLTVANNSVCLNTRNFIYSSPVHHEGGDHSDRLCRKRRVCRAPDFAGVIVTPSKPYYLEGDEISVSCSEGYELVGSDVSVCGGPDPDDDDDGFFDFLDDLSRHIHFGPKIGSVTCSKKTMCKYVNEDGLILTPHKNLYDVGEVVSVSCETGYAMKGEVKRTCRMKDKIFPWSSPKAELSPEIDDEVCEKIPTCEGPGQQQGLLVSGRKKAYFEGDSLKFSCQGGFTLVGPKESVCTEVRSFTALRSGFKKLKFKPRLPKKLCEKSPSCEPPRRSWLKYSPEKPEYNPGETVNLSCADGYKFTGSNDVVECRSVFILTAITTGFEEMRFRPRIPTNPCKKIPTCDVPAPQPGMVILPRKDFYYVGDEIEIVCGGGYELVGPSTSVCSQARSITAIATAFKVTRFKPEIPNGACREKTMIEDGPSD